MQCNRAHRIEKQLIATALMDIAQKNTTNQLNNIAKNMLLQLQCNIIIMLLSGHLRCSQFVSLLAPNSRDFLAKSFSLFRNFNWRKSTASINIEKILNMIQVDSANLFFDSLTSCSLKKNWVPRSWYVQVCGSCNVTDWNSMNKNHQLDNRQNKWSSSHF